MTKSICCLLFGMLISIVPLRSLSADVQPDSESIPKPEVQSQHIKINTKDDAAEKSKPVGIAPIPIVFYTPETSLAFGGGIIFTFRDPDRPADKRPDNLQLIAAYSLKNQIFLSLSPEIHFNEKNGKLYVQTGYTDWPTSFFGIGNETDIDTADIDDLEEVYSHRSFMVQPWIVHKVVSHLSLGATLDLKRSDISDTENDGLLEQGEIPGSDGGVRSGLGPALIWDSRNSLFFPTRGSWHKIWSWHYRDQFGSDFDYNLYGADFRNYRSLKPGHILAWHLAGISTDGDVPFDELPTPPIRGLYEGLFIDKNMLTLELEYRFPLKGPWSGAAFAGVGDIFEDTQDLEFQNLKYAAGGGLRFAIDKKEKINLRVDIGVSRYGVFPYVLFQESF